MNLTHVERVFLAIAAASLAGCAEPVGDQGATEDGRIFEEDIGEDDTEDGNAGVEVDPGVIAEDYPPFAEVDTSNDGLLNRVELAAVDDLELETLDVDDDGFVSADEYLAIE